MLLAQSRLSGWSGVSKGDGGQYQNVSCGFTARVVHSRTVVVLTPRLLGSKEILLRSVLHRESDLKLSKVGVSGSPTTRSFAAALQASAYGSTQTNDTVGEAALTEWIIRGGG